MGVNISYMGTKRELAPAVSEVVRSAKTGPVLDVFSGMCSVGEEIGTSRQVWVNDIQEFAYFVGTALFTATNLPLNSSNVSDVLFDDFDDHFKRLRANFSRSLDAENDLLNSVAFDEFERKYRTFKNLLISDGGKKIRHAHHLFTKLYSDSFFGLGQSIEIDAIVASIDSAIRKASLSSDHRRWLIIAIARAMLRVSNSTGHFAQFLKPNERSYKVFLRQRRRSVWLEMLSATDRLNPLGTSRWRRGNKSYNRDSVLLLNSFRKSKYGKPSVVYADPPYTDDQYSRFYHLFETLIRYDYPIVEGAGRYRRDRFRTPFSLKSQAPEAIGQIISGTARLGADLVLSYPTNGLIVKAGFDVAEMMRRHFSKVELCHAISRSHSTFGASKGAATTPVVEQIFLGRQ